MPEGEQKMCFHVGVQANVTGITEKAENHIPLRQL